VSSFAALRGVQGGVVVVSDPVDIGAVVEQVLRGFELSAVACALEAAGYVVGRGLVVVEVLLDLREESEGGGLPKGDASAAVDQAPGGCPLSECGGADALPIRKLIVAALEGDDANPRPRRVWYIARFVGSVTRADGRVAGMEGRAKV
jgi:hypothetical protein